MTRRQGLSASTGLEAMMRPLLALTLLLAPLAGCVGQAHDAAGAGPTGQLDGAVVARILHPFDGQAVYLVQLGWRDDTSPLGGFTFRDVPVGTYTVLASHDGVRRHRKS